MTGIELAERVHADGTVENIPIVARRGGYPTNQQRQQLHGFIRQQRQMQTQQPREHDMYRVSGTSPARNDTQQQRPPSDDKVREDQASKM